MIQINCTQCKTLLTIDEAFAGGVCRCRHCGAIQTVPKHLKDQPVSDGGGGGVATQVTGTKTQKTLYQKKGASGDGGGGSSGTGMDELAGIVSSGLTSGRLKRGGATAAGANRKTVMIVAACGIVIAILVTVIIVMSVRDKTGAGDPAGTPANQTAGTGGGVGTNSAAGGGTGGGEAVRGGGTALTFKGVPAFLGQNISEKTVAYVIDCGQAARSEGKFDLLRQAVARSVASLGDQRRFQVLFWAQDGQVHCFPADGPAPATTANVAECAKWLDGMDSGGQTMVSPALDKAFKGRPDAVMVVAVKAALDDNFAPNAAKRRADAKSGAKYYTFSIQQPELADVLRKVAGDSKGAYRDVSVQELRAAGE